jgi:NADP-dependent 3-hydroxy acid dehydrogenase YdfG
MNINKNIIIITGSNSGIGFECVKQFCEEYTCDLIVAISRNTDHLQKLPYTNLQIIACDVTDYEKLQTIINSISAKYQISGLIACAGIAHNGDFCDIDITKIQQMIDVNTTGLTNTIELILPHMRLNKLGTIINVSSLSDRYPRPSAAVYGATKAFVKSLSDSLRCSEAKHNIRVCNVSPAIVDTPLLANLGKNLDDMIAVTDFVNVVKFIYKQPQSICIRDMVIAPTKYEN